MTTQDLSWVLKKPRLTEKAVNLGGQNVYTFDVDMRANKILVKQAIEYFYKVSPTKVNVVVSKPKAVRFKGKPGTRTHAKKAYVTLKKGDTINFI